VLRRYSLSIYMVFVVPLYQFIAICNLRPCAHHPPWGSLRSTPSPSAKPIGGYLAGPSSRCSSSLAPRRFQRLRKRPAAEVYRYKVNLLRYIRVMEIYTTEEVADMLRVSPSMIRSLIRNKKLPALKINTEYRIRKEDLDEFLENSKTM